MTLELSYEFWHPVHVEPSRVWNDYDYWVSGVMNKKVHEFLEHLGCVRCDDQGPSRFRYYYGTNDYSIWNNLQCSAGRITRRDTSDQVIYIIHRSHKDYEIVWKYYGEPYPDMPKKLDALTYGVNPECYNR